MIEIKQPNNIFSALLFIIAFFGIWHKFYNFPAIFSWREGFSVHRSWYHIIIQLKWTLPYISNALWDISVYHIFKDQKVRSFTFRWHIFYMLFGWKFKLDKRKQLLAKCCLAYSKEEKRALMFQKNAFHILLTRFIRLQTQTGQFVRINLGSSWLRARRLRNTL